MDICGKMSAGTTNDSTRTLSPSLMTEAAERARADIRHGGAVNKFVAHKHRGGVYESRFADLEPALWAPVAQTVFSPTTKTLPGALLVRQHDVDIFGVAIGDVVKGSKVVRITAAYVCTDKLKITHCSIVKDALVKCGTMPTCEPEPAPLGALEALDDAQLDVSDAFRDAVRLAVDDAGHFELLVVLYVDGNRVSFVNLLSRTARGCIPRAAHVALVQKGVLTIANITRGGTARRDFAFRDGQTFKTAKVYMFRPPAVVTATMVRVTTLGLVVADDTGDGPPAKRQRTSIVTDISELMEGLGEYEYLSHEDKKEKDEDESDEDDAPPAHLVAAAKADGDGTGTVAPEPDLDVVSFTRLTGMANRVRTDVHPGLYVSTAALDVASKYVGGVLARCATEHTKPGGSVHDALAAVYGEDAPELFKLATSVMKRAVEKVEASHGHVAMCEEAYDAYWPVAGQLDRVRVSAVAEYLLAEVFELAGNVARDEYDDIILVAHISKAIQDDRELSELTDAAPTKPLALKVDLDARRAPRRVVVIAVDGSASVIDARAAAAIKDAGRYTSQTCSRNKVDGGTMHFSTFHKGWGAPPRESANALFADNDGAVLVYAHFEKDDGDVDEDGVYDGVPVPDELVDKFAGSLIAKKEATGFNSDFARARALVAMLRAAPHAAPHAAFASDGEDEE